MYRYRVRPEYGSGKLLIELLPASADEAFFGELLEVLKQVNARMTDVCDLWVNAEVLLSFDSDLGSFLVSKDVWDSVFIMASENQPVVLKIADALGTYSQFQREVVDFSEYT